MPPTISIQTTTNQFLAPAWVDQVLKDNFFFGKILEKTEKWKGSQMLFPIKYQKGVASVAFNGFDLLPITQQPVAVNMTFYPTFVATNVALAGSDLSVNKNEGNGALKTLDLMKSQMESRAQDAADDIGNFFQADGTAFGGKAPMGLAGIVDDGTTLASYGSLSRATYTGLNATVTASGGTISLLKTRQLWNSISDGPIRPDTILTDYTTWAYFEQLLTPFQRNTLTNFEARAHKAPQTSSVAGYSDIVWDGMEVYRDKKVTAGNFYMLNTDYLKFYGLNWWEGDKVSPKAKDIEGNVYEDSMYAPENAFTWTGWIRAYNQGAINGFMILGGQLLCTAPLRNGLLSGVTGV
jgi:hypothetical protein